MQGGAVRRPGNGPGPRRLRPDPRTSSAAPCSTSARSPSTSTASDFTLNPTNCSPIAVGGDAAAAAAPTRPTRPPSAPSRSRPRSRSSGCEHARLQAEALPAPVRRDHARRKNPKLRAVLMARDGDANIGRASVALPHALFLDQASLGKVCTRVQFAANACPKNSIYGYARAFTPLLDKPLEGPVYLRSSDNPLPDLVAAPARPGRHRPGRPHRQLPRRHPHHLRHASPTCRSRSSSSPCRAASTACWSPRATSAEAGPRRSSSSKARTARRPTSGRSCARPAARSGTARQHRHGARALAARSAEFVATALDSRLSDQLVSSVGDVGRVQGATQGRRCSLKVIEED